MAGRVISDSDRDVLAGLGIDPDTLGTTTTEVRMEDRDTYIPIKGLPSGGRFYKTPNGLPVTLKAMPFKVEDAIALHAMQDEENHEVIDDVFRKRIRGVPPEELLEMDRRYILGWMREQTFAKAPLRRSFNCPNCNKTNLHRIISISDFATYYLPADVSEPEFDLPEAEIRVKLKFERRKDIIRVKDYIKSFEGFRQITPADVRNFRIASLIAGKSLETALEFMADLSVIDYSVLTTQFDRCNMGMTEVAAVKCDNEKGECDHVNLVHIPFRREYYLPRIGSDMVDEGEGVII